MSPIHSWDKLRTSHAKAKTFHFVVTTNNYISLAKYKIKLYFSSVCSSAAEISIEKGVDLVSFIFCMKLFPPNNSLPLPKTQAPNKYCFIKIKMVSVISKHGFRAKSRVFPMTRVQQELKRFQSLLVLEQPAP